MAVTSADGRFWLPADFLTDCDMGTNKENFNGNGLPSEFSYGFGPFSSSSPVESFFGSAGSESDEDDLLAGLARQLALSTLCAPQKLEKTWGFSCSPQSTLSTAGSWSNRSAVSSNGSPNGPSQFPSPPTTPLGGMDDAWDLIYAAAGQVARMKLNSEGLSKSRGRVNPPPSLSQYGRSPNFGVSTNQCLPHTFQKQECSIWGNEGRFPHQLGLQNRDLSGGRQLGLALSAWPPLQVHQLQDQAQLRSGSGVRTGFNGGSGGVKRECAGTGVFLPRRYDNPTESRKKQEAACSPTLLPARVVQSLNRNLDMSHMTAPARPQAQPARPHYNGTFIPDYGIFTLLLYTPSSTFQFLASQSPCVCHCSLLDLICTDLVMARRNALLAQQQRRRVSPVVEGAMSHEIRLPQEWTY
ncbi:hypothetical protein RJ639_032334 [Escallonia herrerae]|uniref:Uncharacterized protein n=1 Tax=Escallonia herrerae TaxID=1293975 RepID=A0AA89B9F2_9ASTE|nr:hypothetical protein RJ639_032334 [Escallonia herrerae]